MTEAIFGLFGVLIGSDLTWFQTYLADKRKERKNANYLAIRMVCILDKFVEDCADVVKDDGLSYGQRDEHGYLSPQIKSPGPPIYPSDLDWRSIDQGMMYRLLSLPSEVESGDRMINFSNDIAYPPDFEDWFDERRFHYSQYGLMAFKLSVELSEKYGIKKKTYNDWNPEEDLRKEFLNATERRDSRMKRHRHFVNQIFRKF